MPESSPAPIAVDPRALAAIDALAARPLVYRDGLGDWVVVERPGEIEGMGFAVFSGRGAEERAKGYAAWVVSGLQDRSRKA